MDLPHSDACYVKPYPAETTEAFCDGHASAFVFLGEVPQRQACGGWRLTSRSPMADWYEQGHRDTIRSTYLRIGS